MKTLIYSFLSVLLAVVIITGCNKSGLLDGQTGKVVATKTTVKINEPDSLILVGAQSTDSVRWSVAPSGSDSLITKKNTALVFFKKAGVYTVGATDNGGTPATVSITVTDSVYHSVTQYTYTPLTGDQITLVPHYYKSSTSDTSYLLFVAQTKNFYCGSSVLQTSYSLVSNVYTIGFLQVIQPSPCAIGQLPISSVINFTTSPAGPVPDGTFPLSVTLNGTTYTGSITVTDTNITYNWTYTSGVLISPQQITR